MSNDSLKDFVALSSALTGIPAGKLRPVLDTHGTAQTYQDYAKAQAGDQFERLMQVYSAHSAEPPEVLASIIIEQSGDDIAIMAQAVMLMWYLGAWYPIDGLKAYKAGTSKFAPSIVISSDTYTQGWAWKVGQAHPMGYSELRFGYWNGAPQSLNDLAGGA
ncbi:hypothetical protein GCM10023115_00850 [Pontixanthobacter gangjinensis]|uniref:Sorbitol dehydrogenase n=1 Tax=Pontixanthobacter gangjinensis TaxID=1028742 RepID=A0A6I4SJP5_9SPHN|nr:hypothetical protein [Pontixanthobacter gangjinensis]MXO55340.1 hypothetical protein [Pontixanthobacter gangjinensis]